MNVQCIDCGLLFRYPGIGPKRCIACLIRRSSLGTPEAKALREKTSPEMVERVMRRMRELERK